MTFHIVRIHSSPPDINIALAWGCALRPQLICLKIRTEREIVAFYFVKK
jgi:hypothetical protein